MVFFRSVGLGAILCGQFQRRTTTWVQVAEVEEVVVDVKKVIGVVVFAKR